MKFKLLSLLVAMMLVISACGQQTTSETSSEPAASEAASDVSEEASEASEEVSEEASEASEEVSEETSEASEEATAVEADGNELVLKRAYSAPHGDRGFARVVVAMNGDKIVDVAIDEYQYTDSADWTLLPNFDKGLAEGSAEGVGLASKVENSDVYSASMAEKAGSTVAYADNFKAIVDFVKGKTAAEIEEVINGAEEGKPIDAVTGATLVDTAGYLQAIVDATTNDYDTVTGTFENLADVTLTQTYGAPHGEKSFGDAVVALEGDKIVAASIDEFQYSKGEGLPSSDGAMAENFADAEKPLTSKVVNSESYSKNMAEKAGSTVAFYDNIKAIENFVAGKTVEEVETVIGENEMGTPVDAVTGATLADTVGYLQLIVDATK